MYEEIKLPPFDIESERAIIGIVILDNKKFHNTAGFVNAEDFYETRNKVIFRTMRDMILEGLSIDLLTLKNKLQAIGKLKECGGVPYIAKIADDVFSSYNLDAYLKIVKEKSQLRKMITWGNELVSSCYSASDTVEKISNKMIENLVFLKNIEKRKVQNIDHGMDFVIDKVKSIANEPEKYGGIFYGLHNLDMILNGAKKQEITIIAGRPSKGKTSLMATIVVHVAIKKKRKVLFVSLDQSFTAMQERIISALTKLNNKIFKTGSNHEKIIQKINEAQKLFSESVLLVNDNSMSVSELCSLCYKYKLVNEIDLILIDYLQCLSADGKFQNKNDEVTYISKCLKKLSSDLDVPIMVASQLSRSNEKRTDTKPMLSDLRDSGSIEQDANVVLMLWQSKESMELEDRLKMDFNKNDIDGARSIVDMFIAKNKDGETGDLKFNFYKAYTLFEDYDGTDDAVEY